MIDISTTSTFFNTSDFSLILDENFILKNKNITLQKVLFASLIVATVYIAYSTFQTYKIRNQKLKIGKHE